MFLLLSILLAFPIKIFIIRQDKAKRLAFKHQIPFVLPLKDFLALVILSVTPLYDNIIISSFKTEFYRNDK